MKIELIPMNLRAELGKLPLEYDKENIDPDIAGNIWIELFTLFSNLGVLDPAFSLKLFIESRASYARKGLANTTVYDTVLRELVSNSATGISEINYAASVAVPQYFKLRTFVLNTVSGNVGHMSMQEAITKDQQEIAQAITALANSAHESPVLILRDLIMLTHALVNSEVVGYLKPLFYFIEPANKLVLDEMNRWRRNMASLHDKVAMGRAIGESREL